MKSKTVKSPYNMWQNTCYMIRLAWKEKEKKVLILGLLSASFSVLVNLVNLYIAPTVLSVVERKASVQELIITIFLCVGALMLCSAALAYVDVNTLFGRITLRTTLLKYMNHKALTTSYPNVEDEEFIKLSAQCATLTNNNDEATEAIWSTLTSLLRDSIGFIIYMLLLSSVKPILFVVILVTAILGYSLSTYIVGYEYRHRDEMAEYTRRMWYISECASMCDVAKDIRIFGMRGWLEELNKKTMGAYMGFRQKAEGIYIWSKIADLVLAFLRNGIIYAYLIHLVYAGSISAAQFLLYFSAVGGFSAWVCGILKNLSILHRQSLDISTVRQYLEYPEVFLLEGGEPLVPDEKESYEIGFENVSFHYPKSDKDILSNINLTLHPGEKLAVVGLNGAGKTTFIKLLCGFLDPTEGRILLNGKDIREYNRWDYYQMFCAVFQSFSQIAGSIALNVAQTEDDIDMSRVKECIKKAGLLNKIESLPEGYEARLNRQVYENAIMLSGGETQRLMLARALYKDAPIVVLDEPTAALDSIAEAELYQKYNEMTKGKSSVYISHRLASTRFCDRIILIENSRIAEEGSHETLMEQGGRYAYLFSVQSQYYQEEHQPHMDGDYKEGGKEA